VHGIPTSLQRPYWRWQAASMAARQALFFDLIGSDQTVPQSEAPAEDTETAGTPSGAK
jgi:hypothetical protein